MAISTMLMGIVGFFIFYGRVPQLYLMILLVALFGLGFYFFVQKRHQHSGFLSIDRYAQRSSLNMYHPALKTYFTLGCISLSIAANSIAVSLFLMITMTILTVYVGKVPLHQYLSLLAVPGAFILLGAVAILFEISPRPMGLLDIPLGHWSWYLCVTPTSQTKALLVISKAFGAVCCLYMLNLSTPLYRIIGVLRRANLPPVMVELMYLIYRYIFVLLETQIYMKNAAEARLGYRNYRTSLKTMLNSSWNLLFWSFRRSADCFAAMEARCYDGEVRFWEDNIHIGKIEALTVAIYSAMLLVLCVFAWRGGL